jgi:hypothetical protein
MRNLARIGVGVLIALGAVSAGAQTAENSVAPVWRCGNTYSHQPCGSGQTVPTQDARTPEQREHAQVQQQRLNALLNARDQERAAQAAQEQQRAAAAQREQKRQLALQQREAKKAKKVKRAAEKAHAARNKYRLQQTRERRVVIAPSPNAAP